MKKNKNWWSWLFLFVGLLVTFYLALNIKSNIDKIAETEFKFQSKEISSKIVERLQAHAQVLQSSAAFLTVSDTVTRKQWKDFIDNSKANLYLTCVQDLGFSLIISKDNLEEHIQKIRSEGFPNYKISPEDMRDPYTSIIYLEPFSENNLVAFGYDMMTEPVLREAMERARDMDAAAFSGKVLLAQETATDIEAGNLMYVPVYRKGAVINSVEERRAAIVGWVFSPYRMNDLMMGIMDEWGSQINKKLFVHIFDGSDNSPQSLLYESHEQTDSETIEPEHHSSHSLLFESHEQSTSENIRFSNQIPVTFNGYQWLLEFHRPGNIIIDYMTAWTVLFGGVIISILLFLFTKSLLNTNYKARLIADWLTLELKENEKLLRESQEIAGLGSYSLDLTTGVWKSSKILDKIFGINKSYIKSIDGWGALIHPDHKEKMVDYLNNTVINKKQPFNKEYKIVKNNNTEERWVHGIGKLEFDSQNNPISMIGTISDITERKLAEEKLRLSREQYKSLFENSPLGIYQTKPDGTIINANPALLKMLEFDSLSELQKRDLNKEGYSEQSSVSRQQFVEIIEREGFVKGLEENWETQNGKIIPVRENARVIRGKNGETLYYEGTVEDITERKRAENVLRESEERYALAVDGSKDGLWDWDIANNEVYFSPRWKNMLGYEDGELENKFSTWENLLHPDDIEQATSTITAYFNQEIPKYEIEFRMRHKDGSYRWVLARAEVLRNEDSKPYRMAGSHTDITERKNAEKELKESEERFRLIVETVPIPLIITKVSDGTIILANESLGKLFNISVTKSIGKKTPNFYYNPNDRDKLLKTFFKNGFVDNYEVMLKKLDGVPMCSSVSLKLMTLNNEQVIIAGFHDLTNQKKDEKKIKDLNENLEERVIQRTLELQQTKNRFEYLLTSAPVVIYTLEAVPPFKTTFMGKNIFQMVGYKPEQFMGNPTFWDSKIHRDDAQYVFDEMQEILKKDKLALEYRFLQNDGTYRWMHDELLIVKDVNGKPTELLGYWIDITERKEYEERLQETLKEISDYKIALDESSIVTITDQRGIINYVNDNVCKISKYQRNELIGQDHRIINSGFHSKEFFRNLWSTITNGQTWKGEIKNKAKDGSFYWVDTTIVPFLNTKGKPYQYIAIRSDITSRKLIEEDLIKSKETADTANRAKSEFLANMSHEIRTPMNAIIGFSELLYNTMENEKQRSQIASIRSSGKNLLNIINDILDLSKIEAGKLSLQTETVNIHRLAKEMEMMFAHTTGEKDISFYIETESEIPSALLLDETRLRQVLFNLLGNAVKFTDKGHIILTLDKKSKENNLIDLTIKVEDTGIGIPKTQQKRIFEAFSQQEGQMNSKYGGTGLGLTITKRLVEMMGGKISVHSVPDKGSIFTVYLPDVKIGEIDDLTRTKITFDPASVIFKEAKVLIVDDNKENRNLITNLLENSPLTLFKAENGKEAVEIATQNLPDLILMDLRMPVMNGYEATQILKNQKSTKSIPVISISASTKIFSKKGNLKSIFNDSLMKPIDLTELVQLLKKYLKYQKPKNKAVINKKELKEIPFELTAEQLKKLPELIHTLENEFMPAYRNAVKTQMIDQIEKFGKDLAVFAKKRNSKIILDYGHEICSLADNFEIDKLITTLNKFPEIIKQHKSLINNS